MERRINMEVLHNFFLDPEVNLRPHTMIVNAPTEELTLIHLVTFSISRSCI